MVKKLLSSALALCMVFGTAAVLPEGAVSQSLQIVASADYVYTDTYDGFEYQYSSNDDSVAIITGYTKKDTASVTIPSVINGKRVTKISELAFGFHNEVESITISDGITEIIQGAFAGCENLTSITIPDRVKIIGDYPFDKCKKLKTINFGKENSDFVFSNGLLYSKDTKMLICCLPAVAPENVTIPEGIEVICPLAFDGCENVKTIKMPEGLKSIEGYAFQGCINLESLKLPDSLTEINILAFERFPGTKAPGIKRIDVGQGNKYFSSIDGSLYSKDGKYLIWTSKKSINYAEVSGLKNRHYTGKAIKQTPVVKVAGKTLKAGTDYTVSYKNNKAVGTATVTITGKGAYTGTVKATFKICPKKTTLKTAKSPKTKQLKVTYSKVAGVTGYQVTYSTSSKFTKAATTSVNVKGTSKTISKLTKGKTYYVKVRSYKTVDGKKYYSGYSAVKKVKVK